jgi:hypothetical protein
MKLNCYIVKDLLPNYIDNLTKSETNEDIEEHLKSCENCKIEFEQLSKPIKDKKYKKTIITITVVSILCLCLLLLVIWAGNKIYSLQYNNKDVSNYINITIDDSIGKAYLCEADNYSVYTYNLRESSVIDFGANTIDLKDALENKKIDLDDLTRHLNYEDGDSGRKIYIWENYQIIFSGKECVIAPLNINIEEITLNY